MSVRSKSLRNWITSFLVLVPASAWGATCALCRQALESGGGSGLLKGFYWSIVLISVVPLIVLGIGFRYALRHWK